MIRINDGRLAETLNHGGAKFGFASAVFGGHAAGFTETKAVGAIDLYFVVVEIGFVDDEQDVALGLAEHLRDALIETGNTLETVDHKENQISRGDGEIDLFFRELNKLGRGFTADEAKTAGVEQRVCALGDFRRNDVAGDAGLVVDDGNAFTRQAVEEATFADIGSADDGNGTGHV